MGLFNITKDTEVETAGGFWCHGCLVGKPLDDVSPDLRYCISCYEFLKKEAEQLINRNRRPSWIPKDKNLGGKKRCGVSHHGGGIMQTTNATKNQSLHNYVPDPPISPIRRGPKSRELPNQLIAKWSREGMGSKAIALRLKNEQGIIVHYATIHRRLNAK